MDERGKRFSREDISAGRYFRVNSIIAKISSRENISNSLFAKFSSRENKVLYSILARLFLAVVLPPATYGLTSLHTNGTLVFLDEVQGRLIKAWFGVSKYCPTSSLRAAIGWRKASECHLSTSAEPKCIIDPLFPIPIHLPAHSRRNMGLWYSNGLHDL